ncbi:InlB B-repeat-containing protein [Collinsella sp. AGMB00827]|uniref:InlB B-repeat-containing protein n=1 Tax=Collinsella ureilytica TaxID=2869515 RepID=A0ABS7MJY7_9ACTN|nr:Rib/alpha-like domain-containing protein [Collinsella urealyticum]MBY4797679.1 InlB B-repeat-containing protein [Collinsella urealyticum]
MPFGPEKCKFRNFVRYIASYNPLVSFDVNGGVLAKPEDAQQEIEPNSPYAKRPADPTREGYTFVYWQDLATGKKFDFTTAVKKPYKLQAVWRLIPTGQPVTVEQGSPAPDAKTGIANANDLPDGTTFAWEHTPSTDTIGTTDQVIVVTQPNSPAERVTVKLEVTKKHVTPTGQPVTVEQGSPAPDAKTGIANANDLPDGTTFAWEHTPSTDTIGTTDQVIVVTQPDGTIDRIVIKLEIKKKDSEKKTPKTKKTKSIKKDKGTSLPQTSDASSIAALLASASAASMFVAGSVLRKKRA